MAVTHASLTGAELHESKGVATAATGQMYVADGSGSGAWRTLVYTDYKAGPHVIIEDQKTNGTNGGTCIVGVNQRNLNTLVYNPFTLATLSANQFTLPAGSYYFSYSAPCNDGNNHRVYLWNVTDSAAVSYGTSEFALGTYGGNCRSMGSGAVTIASTKTFELRHYTQQAIGGQGLGQAVSSGVGPEVYARIEITKLA